MTLSLKEARERLRNTIEEYIRVEAELHALEDTNYRVCIFGSARLHRADPIYQSVYGLARSLSKRGIDVVTGGGPGLMEAANRGVLAARRGRSTSYGLTLDLPTLVEPANPHLDITSSHKRFSSRLDEFIRLSHAVVVAPGGIGTLLELMYVWQLLQLHTVEARPVILLGREFWGGMLDWMREMPAAMRLLDPKDLDAVQVVDTAEEALAILDQSHAQFLTERLSLADLPGKPELDRLMETADEMAEDLALQVQFSESTLDSLVASA